MRSVYCSDEHDPFRHEVRRFVETEFRRMGELGYPGIPVPEAHARGATITAGTSEIMREIIARAVIEGGERP